MTVDLFKDIINSILVTKVNVIRDSIDLKEYKPFIVNRALSYHLDCLPYVNELNMCGNLDPDMQYNFYLHSIRGMKRKFQPWQTKTKVGDLDIVKQYFGYSNEKAKDALSLLSADQIEEIRKKLDKGGIKK